MREIRQSGSEGGAVMNRPYLYRVRIVVTLLRRAVQSGNDEGKPQLLPNL